MKTSGNTILITGGGSGIGEALAHRFQEAGNYVVIAGRRQDALDRAIAGRPNMSAMTLDVDSAEGVEDFARRVMAAHPKINVLVNNAGIMRFEDLGAHRDLSDAEAMVVTNLLGPIRLTNALTDHLAAQDDAAIVNLTSGLAYLPLEAAPTYSATKAAIHSYTASLRAVLKGRIEVIELVPPAVQTDLTPGQRDRDGYQPLADFIDEVMTLFGQTPTPGEILVERAKFFRNAEAEGRFDESFAQINAFAREAH